MPGQEPADSSRMVFKRLNFEIVEGTTEGISYSGIRKRRSTVLIRMGSKEMSKQAVMLGLLLSTLQICDALLTYIGLRLHGIHLEGNGLLAELMYAYGLFPALLITKLAALCLIVALTIVSNKRKWIRPFIFMLCAAYITLAIVPWTFIISSSQAGPALEISSGHK
jgi:hypothetical protein